MPYVDFTQIQTLKPAAFKLYVYWLHRAEQAQTYTWSVSLAQLGQDSHLQVHPPWRYPAQYHGQDGTLRSALKELIDQGFLEKTGQRGRRPNTYRLLKSPEKDSIPTPQMGPTERRKHP
jgi:hypothetical protein